MIALVAYIMLGIAGIAFALACVPRSAWSRMRVSLARWILGVPRTRDGIHPNARTYSQLGDLVQGVRWCPDFSDRDEDGPPIHTVAERDACGMPTRIEAYRAREADVQRSIEWDDVTPDGKVEVIR